MPTASRRRYTSSDTTNYQRELANFRATDTVVVGNGPAALFLSYILHGHVPRYDPITYGPHPDPILHSKLLKLCAHTKPLTEILDSPKAISFLTEHFHASSLSYSDQALPVNVLLDTLMRPNADTEIGELKSRLKWEKVPGKRVDHIVLGSAQESGGQWSEEPVSENWDIGTLSYAEMFTLPGYSFPEHYTRLHRTPLPDLIRPTRRDVASYYSHYPRAVGINGSILSSTTVQKISRNSAGFTLRVQRRKSAEPFIIVCRHLVLATGIFTFTIPPPPIFAPLLQRGPQWSGAVGPERMESMQRMDQGNMITGTLAGSGPGRDNTAPILVVGSGFTAADVILSQPKGRRIVHIYKWNPSRPSPLKGCHPQAYPEYAEIYRQMKLATTNPPAVTPGVNGMNGVGPGGLKRGDSKRGDMRPPPPKPNTSTGSLREWGATYEGYPNSQIISVDPTGVIKILTSDNTTIERSVSSLKYCAGRKGSLGYLAADLRKEVGVMDAAWVSADTLRRRVETDLMVAEGVWVVGSLTGDSLVRYGLGSGVYTAGRIQAESVGKEGGAVEGDVATGGKEGKGGKWAPNSCVIC
ncbi:Similar to Oxidative stress-induced growth inhibitor 1; acc. no. Q9UJX0 [Pyronema omphalodes CBS 100304]|uniref:Similar to Oxidative stress-induced growth inhibitor 1 acc. no. Q9UJX0 n=1 Tax=Pyronema omphalodes (strain CBS 100304) TaxID=1076935 RepID=U4LKE0_PYROM|nr:Similar to Oxidative stress-induced growth inhibitor 1; acc. no. Q9UJX0 [Pyronema omphalodes CBS 100304]